MAAATCGGGVVVVTAILAATSSSSGPRCRVRRWMTRVIDGAVDERGLDRRDRARASPPRRAAGSSSRRPRTIAIDDEQQRRWPAMPTPSQRPLPVSTARPTPISARTRPIERAEVLQQHDRAARAPSRVRTNATQRPARAAWLRLVDRGAEREATRATIANEQDDERPLPATSSGSRVLRSCGRPRRARTGRRRVNSTIETMNA